MIRPATRAAGVLVVAAAVGATLTGCADRALQPEPPPAPPAPVIVVVPTVAQRFVGAALEMLGEPYRYGGDEPGGFDCSGLVAYAAARIGIPVPRTAHEQLRSGVEVARDQMQPGDLVFMRLKRELHVGIVSAPGLFVHAPSSGGRVRVDQLDARPYRDAFVTARRIQP